jgi:tRNA(Ile)-lysidine synthase
MCPLGLDDRQRKLSDILIDAKVPVALRARVPIVRLGGEDEDQVVWLAGLRVDNRARLTASTAQAVRLTFIDGSVRS